MWYRLQLICIFKTSAGDITKHINSSFFQSNGQNRERDKDIAKGCTCWQVIPAIIIQGQYFGFHRGMDTLGAVIGPLIALLLLNIYSNNFRLVFLIAFVPSLAAIGVSLLIKDRKIDVAQRSRKLFPIGFWKEAPKDYKILTVLFTLFSLVNSSDVFLILRSKDISHSTSAAILVYVFYNFVYASASYPVGILSDKLGRKIYLSQGF